MRYLLPLLLLCGTPAFAGFSAPAAGQSCYASVTTGTTVSCSLTNNPTTGNVVVASLLTFTGLTAGAGSVVDTNANSYSTPVCRNTNDATAGTACMAFFIATGTAHKTVTLTVTGGTCGACSIRIDEFTVSGGTASLDGSILGGSGTTQAITGPTVTPAGAGELLVAQCVDANSCGATGGSWTAEPGGLGTFLERTEYQLAAGTAQATNFAGVTAVAWDAVGGAWKITASGTPVPKLTIMGVGN